MGDAPLSAFHRASSLKTPLLPLSTRTDDSEKKDRIAVKALGSVYGVINHRLLYQLCMVTPKLFSVILRTDPFGPNCANSSFSAQRSTDYVLRSLVSSVCDRPSSRRRSDISIIYGDVYCRNRNKGGMGRQSDACHIFGMSLHVHGSAWMCLGTYRQTQTCISSVVFTSPVIGGYLAFIGYFCLIAGFNLCTGGAVVFSGVFQDDLKSYEVLFSKKVYILKCIPAVVCGVFLYLVSTRVKNFLGLPLAIVAIPVGFYTAMACLGLSMDQVRQDGWMDVPQNEPFYDVFLDFDFNAVKWGHIPSQAPMDWYGLCGCFGSCLDVAAIQTDAGKQLRINHELETVELSNVVSGLLGGFTGSYIFSQTIFTFRTRVHKNRRHDRRHIRNPHLPPFSLMSIIPVCRQRSYSLRSICSSSGSFSCGIVL